MGRVNRRERLLQSPGVGAAGLCAAVLLTVVAAPAGAGPCDPAPDWWPDEAFGDRRSPCRLDPVGDLQDGSLQAPTTRPSAPETRHHISAAGFPSPAPRISGALPHLTSVRLHKGFALAVREVDQAECRALFSPLGTDALDDLATSLYYAAPGTGGPCKDGTAAFTVVGSPATWLCPVFERLVSEDAALILIHEALHKAGLPESLSTPGAMTSDQINRMVRTSCTVSLGSERGTRAELLSPWDRMNSVDARMAR
jgi:hypothetical protein